MDTEENEKLLDTYNQLKRLLSQSNVEQARKLLNTNKDDIVYQRPLNEGTHLVPLENNNLNWRFIDHPRLLERAARHQNNGVIQFILDEISKEDSDSNLKTPALTCLYDMLEHRHIYIRNGSKANDAITIWQENHQYSKANLDIDSITNKANHLIEQGADVEYLINTMQTQKPQLHDGNIKGWCLNVNPLYFLAEYNWHKAITPQNFQKIMQQEKSYTRFAPTLEQEHAHIMHAAAQHGSFEAFQAILEADKDLQFDPTAVDSKGHLPIDNFDDKQINELLENHNISDAHKGIIKNNRLTNEGLRPIHDLILEANTSEKCDNVISQLDLYNLKARNLNGDSALHIAAKAGQKELIEPIIRQQKGINKGKLGKFNCSDMIASESKDGKNALHYAAEAGDWETSQELIRWLTPLHCTPSPTKPDTVIESFLKNELDESQTRELLNRQDNQGNTLLHLAAKNGQHQFLSEIAKDTSKHHLFDWDARNNRGDNMAHVAAQSNKASIPDTLEAIRDISKVTSKNRGYAWWPTPSLLNMPANNEQGNYPAHYAAKNENQAALEKLKELGYGQQSTKNNDGQTPDAIIGNNNQPTYR